MLKYALLGFLSYRPMTGYELKQMMDQSTANFWHAKLSQIYPTLKSLEDEGLAVSSAVPQQSRPDRRVYTITDAGRQDLDTWVRTPDLEIAPSKEPFLLKLFFSAQAGRETLLTHLHLQRELYTGLLERYEGETAAVIAGVVQQAPHLRKDALLWEATRRSGEIIARAVLDWLDETIEMVKKEF